MSNDRRAINQIFGFLLTVGPVNLLVTRVRLQTQAYFQAPSNDN
jgi:hypothetical protein